MDDSARQLEIITELYYHEIYKYCRRRVDTNDTACDITQNVFLSLSERYLTIDKCKDRKWRNGGMKQRLTLAQAVLGNPEILILDEPTAGLDPKQRIAIRNYISKIAFNKIVLIATHVVSDIEFIARSIIMLKKGVITDNAPPHDLIRKMDGKVWNILCAETDVQPMQETFRITNITREETTGAIQLRVLADERPAATASAVITTLEDYYLYVFGEKGG